MTVYNFQLHDLNGSTITQFLYEVFGAQSNTFKISISFSCILKNSESNELSFYWSSLNNQLLFDKPRFIRNKNDCTQLAEDILGKDLQEHVRYPNTKYTFVKATNVTFYVTKLPSTPIGAPIELPDFIRYNKGLISLRTSNKTGKVYEDNLCFFRCIALFRGFKLNALERETKQLFKTFIEHFSIKTSEFAGISIDEIEDASKIFDIGINIYSQSSDGSTELIYRTIKQDNVMYLNLCGNHFSFIVDFDKYSKSYVCKKCSKIWLHNGNFRRHLKTCNAGTREVFPNGVFTLTNTIFDQLSNHGITIPEELRFYDYRICFDIECTLSTDTAVCDTDKVSYTFEHELASISICSNVDSYTEPRCIVSDGCPHELVKRFIEYATEIAEKAADLQRQKFADFMPDIDRLEDMYLQERFKEYISQIPVISFNGNYFVIIGYIRASLSYKFRLNYLKSLINCNFKHRFFNPTH